MGLGRAIGAALGPFLYQRLGLTGNTLVAAAANIVALILLLGWVRESESA